MKPAAGIVGMIAHPLEGAWKSVQKPWAKKQEPQQLATRVQHGQQAFEASTNEERQVVIDTFKRLTKRSTTIDRQKMVEAEAQEMLKTDKSRKLTLVDQDSGDEREAPLRPGFPGVNRSGSPDLIESAEDKKSNKPPPLPPRRSPEPNVDDDEAAFQRDLELAKQLSLAEQQGYERGLKEAVQANH
jgi:sterol 3beta-glucosyltransferase